MIALTRVSVEPEVENVIRLQLGGLSDHLDSIKNKLKSFFKKIGKESRCAN